MKKIEIEICMGTACFVMGSANLMRIKESIPLEWCDQIEVTGSFCCNLCRNWKDSKPPIVNINGEIITGADETKILLHLVGLIKEGNDAEPE